MLVIKPVNFEKGGYNGPTFEETAKSNPGVQGKILSVLFQVEENSIEVFQKIGR